MRNLISTGLPQSPSGQKDEDFYRLNPLYLAINNLARIVAKLEGQVVYDQIELAGLNPTVGLQAANHRKLFPKFPAAIGYGKLVNLFVSGTELAAQLADSSLGLYAHGVVNNPAGAAAGSYTEVIFIEGYTNGISGSSLGVPYYLSTNGDVQTPAPTSGLVQPVGFGLNTLGFYLHIVVGDGGAGGGGGVGPAGPAGPQGPRGLMMYVEPEEPEFNFLPGPKGEKGDIGPTGPTGATGPTGPAGTNGTNGSNGINGIDGKTIYIEADEPDFLVVPGPRGATGAQGIQGIQGNAGPTGPAGISQFLFIEAEEPEQIIIPGPKGDKGDTGAPGGGGGGGGSFGVATIDFGATPSVEATFTITVAGMTSTSKVWCFMQGDSTVDNDADAHRLAGASFQLTATPGTGNFSLEVMVLMGSVTGTFKVNYGYSL